VVGTRPNFVKEYLVNQELRRRRAREVLIHTGQHYDFEMSKTFFECFELPRPDYHLHVPNNDPVAFISRTIDELAKVFRQEKPDCVLSYGDVNSTMSAAIAASKLRLPFAHVEGGIRADDRYNPEEINRRVSDVLSDVIFCCTNTDVENLKREGYEAGRIELTGDLMKDALLMTLEKNGIQPFRGDYHVLTLHRQENLDHGPRLCAIIEGLIRADRKIIFPTHPRTMNRLKDLGLLADLSKSRIELCKPMGYVEFLRLTAGANKILTDSGGVRREAYLLRKPCVVLINLSWFPEISRAGWKVLTGPDPEQIAFLVRNFEPTGPYQELFGDGAAHQKIVDELIKRYDA
jgi:UDP-N-acetylglucosamine 2-epimerase